jgi:hypothetical protein
MALCSPSVALPGRVTLSPRDDLGTQQKQEQKADD